MSTYLHMILLPRKHCKQIKETKRNKKKDMRDNMTKDNIIIMNGPELGRRWVSSFNQQKLMFLLQSSNTEWKYVD